MDLGLLTIKKNNALTDGNIPDRKVIANKLVNALYFEYEQKGDTFKIAINDLANMLGMTSNSGKTKEMIADGLKILQQPIEIRNFEYKGKGIKWHSAPFLSGATIYTEDKNYIEIKLSDMLIQGLKQKEHYTIIDLEVSNKFKTKYGLVIWEMYLRYKNAKRTDVPNEVTYQMFSLEELNKKFGTNYKYNSDIMKCINRGLKEIEAITEKKIAVKWQKDFNKFGFFWKKERELPKFETDEREFIKYIRTQYVNELLLVIDNYKNEIFTGEVAIACSSQGKLYDMYQQTVFNKNHSKQLWNYLFTHQNKITALKQAKFDF